MDFNKRLRGLADKARLVAPLFCVNDKLVNVKPRLSRGKPVSCTEKIFSP